ncbi:hypothetical protein [Dysosmobacter sp. Sow4_B12]|uniref:hypothetical protein n=1 Tax=Dysosmobacter sp. Sow4_B12 TaxID=3438777 RepID=UPI003F90EDC7
MNRYEEAMAHCAPPAELEERLRQKVLAAPPAGSHVLRPWSLARKAALAAVLTLALTVSVGAALLVEWDAIFTARFGPEAAGSPVAESLFQKVGVTSSCGDVTLTVREAVGDSKSVYLILDYRLPDYVDRAAVQAAWDSETDQVGCPDVQFYGTGEVTWEDLLARDGERWPELDWTNYASYSRYSASNALTAYRFTNGSGSSVSGQSYDPDTGTLTYLVRFTTQSQTQDLTDQPLTLLVLPPTVTAAGGEQALADHPAIVTFQPGYTARARQGQTRDPEAQFSAEVILSPLSITVSCGSTDLADCGALRQAVCLVWEDGGETPLAAVTQGYGGSESSYQADGQVRYRTSISAQFLELQDISRVAAVRVGDREVSLQPEA